MRKIFAFLIAISVLTICTSAVKTAQDYKVESDKRTAQVSQIKGVSVFIFSTPNSKYDYQGTIKKGFALSGSNDEMINGLAEKARKQYPNCDAIIFSTFDFEKCDVIKFHE